MEVLEINKLSNKLLNISNDRFQDVYEYLDLIEHGNDDFKLTENQKKVLDERRKTPFDQFVSKDEFLNRIQNKYGI
jgi:hypothetical protein